MSYAIEANEGFWRIAGGDRWRLVRAIAQVESAFNPYQVGDQGRAWGLWQMWESFAKQWGPVGWELRRGEPWASAIIMARFVNQHGHLDDRALCLIFHYGHLNESDPDHYWSDVQAVL